MKAVRDRRMEPSANAQRKDDLDGCKYFPHSTILQSDLFKDIPTAYDIPQISNEHCVVRQKVHGKESINLVRIEKIQEYRCIVTCSLDGYVKICSLDAGELICSMNICNPLPARWDLLYTKNRKRLIKIKRAMEVLKEVNSIFRHESNERKAGIKKDSTMFLT